MKIKFTAMIFSIIWSLLILLAFLWNYDNGRVEQERIALESGRSFFNHIVISRLWNAKHGGVYAPVTAKTQPNPYLDTTLRDIIVNDKLTLTKINPAYMTRQISEIAMKQDGVKFHITSLNPLRPANKPTEKEKEFLKAFENGVKEKGMFIQDGTKSSYFYMAPLVTRKSCLQCHAKQGYVEGDIRGGISVTTPFVMEIPLQPLLLTYFLLWLLGLFGIFLAHYNIKKAYLIIQKQADYDYLTSIPNRRGFRRQLLIKYKESRRENKPISVIMCDIDHFKIYNDTYGHDGGDECLKKVAQCIQTSLKRPEDFCARYGGEEFVVLLPNTDMEGAMHVAETIRFNVEKMAIPSKNSSPFPIVTLSLGVETLEITSTDSEEILVKNSDIALYYSKEHGRNQVTHFTTINNV